MLTIKQILKQENGQIKLSGLGLNSVLAVEGDNSIILTILENNASNYVYLIRFQVANKVKQVCTSYHTLTLTARIYGTETPCDRDKQIDLTKIYNFIQIVFANKIRGYYTPEIEIAFPVTIVNL